MTPHPPEELQRIYQARFGRNADYRLAVWRVLIGQCFGRYLRPDSVVLDLGCGYGEFINQADCATRYAMDLNPEAAQRVGPGVKCVLQDCSTPWPFPDGALDLVFTSNFFEHLPDKQALGRTLDEIRRCLKPAGRLIAMGPNIKFLPGAYWDFWDHYVPLTELSLQEALESRGFRIERCVPKFLPYTMASGPRYPLLLLKVYLWFPLLWRIVGKQFLIVAQCPGSTLRVA
jgi:SAM-dependent methyltransferase